MRQFTVKTFIGYNNPCINCNEPINIKICSAEIGIDGHATLRPNVFQDYTYIDLKVTYTNTLKLWMFHQTNQFTASDKEEFKAYLKNHRLFLRSHCDKCYTSIESQYMEFNMDKGYIMPLDISKENIVIMDDTHRYHLFSSFMNDETIIVIDRIDKPTPVSSMRFQAPLMPLNRFRDKEHLISKMKTYLVFS